MYVNFSSMMIIGSIPLLTGQKQTADGSAHTSQDGKFQKRLNSTCDPYFKVKVKFTVQWCNGNKLTSLTLV